MFAGKINTKNTISKMPVICMVDETSKPIAASISIIPVASTICFFAGIKEGNIITIPVVNLKCPSAVNASIADIAILPLTLIFAAPMMAVIPKHKRNMAIRTINGFIAPIEFC